MKNFKKVLALVVVVATLLSFAAMASANNAIKTAEVYDDAASISAEYTEALDVLTAIGVLDGKGSSFKPQDTLKRSEAAKIIAVFANCDPEISSLYASANPFTDVAANHWAVSYIAYAYKTGIIAGVKDGVFAPDARLTGIQFLKMVLCTLGYDAHEEGLVGNSWKVNTLQLAKNVGLTTVLGNAFNYDTELTREAAAQIMLNALNANTVNYGQAVKVANTMTTYTTVAGAVANSEFMYQKWNLKKVANKEDDFRRPAHSWLLNNTPFGKDYTDAPLASYNVKVAGCQILTDCAFDTVNPTGTKTLKVFLNGGPKDNVATVPTVTVADTTELKYGAQGRLTEVYEDRIVYVDTFLAKVNNVVTERVDAQGHILRAANVTATVYFPTPGVTVNAQGALTGFDPKTFVFETTGFVKDQYTRVTVSVKGGKQHIVTMDAVETKNGVLNGYTGTPNTGISQFKFAEEYLNVANGFAYDCTKALNWMGCELVAFMDQYGNVLGVDKYYAALNYGVIDAAWLASENGQAVMKADLVNMNGEVLSAVSVVSVLVDGKEMSVADFVKLYIDKHAYMDNGMLSAAAYAQTFAPIYDMLTYFNVDANGRYVVSLGFDEEVRTAYGDTYTKANFEDEANTVVEFTTGYAWAQKVVSNGATATKTSLVPMDANTVILVRAAGTEVPFASRVTGGYTSYTGYANVPALTANNVWYHLNPTTGYADVIYVSDISVTGTKATVFAAKDGVAMTGITYDALGNKQYNYAVTVYVVDEATGALTKGTYTMVESKLVNGKAAPAVGFHTAYINANNEISFGINNVNYAEADANYMGTTWTVGKRAQEMGPNCYQIISGANNVEINNVTSTTSGYAFDDVAAKSEVSTVASVEFDVLKDDTVYVYQNNNNPANPIYSVVVVFEAPAVKVEVLDENDAVVHTYKADEAEFADYISGYSVGYARRSWEAATAVAKFGYEVKVMMNGGNKCDKNAYGYWYDQSGANATVQDEIIIKVKSIEVGDDSAKFLSGQYYAIKIANKEIWLAEQNVNVYSFVAALQNILDNDVKGGGFAVNAADELNDVNDKATITVYKTTTGNWIEAQSNDIVTNGFAVVLTSENGAHQNTYMVHIGNFM